MKKIEAIKRIENHMEIHNRQEQGLCHNLNIALELAIQALQKEQEREQECAWCKDYNKPNWDSFGVLDEDFGQYVHPNMVKYCPFCGRRLGGKK